MPDQERLLANVAWVRKKAVALSLIPMGAARLDVGQQLRRRPGRGAAVLDRVAALAPLHNE